MQIRELINNILYKQYTLKVENYLFDLTTYQCNVVLKIRFSRCKLNLQLNEIINNQNYINKIHPYDCYAIGIISRLIMSKKIPQDPSILKIIHNNEKFKQCFNFIGIDYKNNNLCFNIINSIHKHNISFNNFIENTHIIRVLSSIDAYKVGFFITDSLIDI